MDGGRERVRLIYENANKEKQKELDKIEQNQYRQVVAPKKESRQEILQNTYNLAKIAMLAQGGKSLSYDEQNKVIEQIVYAAESGAIDIENYKQVKCGYFTSNKGPKQTKHRL